MSDILESSQVNAEELRSLLLSLEPHLSALDEVEGAEDLVEILRSATQEVIGGYVDFLGVEGVVAASSVVNDLVSNLTQHLPEWLGEVSRLAADRSVETCQILVGTALDQLSVEDSSCLASINRLYDQLEATLTQPDDELGPDSESKQEPFSAEELTELIHERIDTFLAANPDPNPYVINIFLYLLYVEELNKLPGFGKEDGETYFSFGQLRTLLRRRQVSEEFLMTLAHERIDGFLAGRPDSTEDEFAMLILQAELYKIPGCGEVEGEIPFPKRRLKALFRQHRRLYETSAAMGALTSLDIGLLGDEEQVDESMVPHRLNLKFLSTVLGHFQQEKEAYLEEHDKLPPKNVYENFMLQLAKTYIEAINAQHALGVLRLGNLISKIRSSCWNGDGRLNTETLRSVALLRSKIAGTLSS